MAEQPGWLGEVGARLIEVYGDLVRRLSEKSAFTGALLGTFTILTFALMALTPFVDRPVQLAIVAVAGVLLTLILFVARAAWPQRANVEPVKPARKIFIAGIEFLQSGVRDQALVYAPTGVWIFDDESGTEKKRWFEAIASALEARTLSSFYGIYGWPQPVRRQRAEESDEHYRAAAEAEIERVEEELAVAVGLLNVFEGSPRTSLCYLKADPSDLPGTGVIVIDHLVALGFAREKSQQKVDYAITMNDPEVAKQVNTWFMTRFNILSVRGQVLYDSSEGEAHKSIVDALPEIRRHLGLPPAA